jgi:rod shape determining protein RodA
MLERLHLDRNLFYALLLLAFLSLVVVYSAAAKDNAVALGHIGRLALGFGVLLVLAQVRPENLERWSPYLFGAGLILLVLVLTMGTTAKGAARWLNLGFVKFQPSEMIKLALPMMLAWFFARDNLPPKLTRLGVAFLLTLVPTALIARQPDLGTALLVLGTGFIVMFLAGMSWRLIIAILAILGAAAPVVWGVMHDYQQNRILTLFNPEADPLGTGYHTIQSMIAVGSGGIYGKGWLNSSQAHLEYLPESATDFIFAVFAEEFGLIGSLLLMALYLFIIVRGMMIAFLAQSTYNRLLAGGLSLSFFLHFFVNVGMVTGILPIVGIPLPILSYGGTSIVTLMAAFGILMSIQTHRKIAEY